VIHNYKAEIRPLIPADWSHDQADLVKRMLIKDPEQRIRMWEIRTHSWTTESGAEAMITKDDNLYYVGQQVEEPTPEELGLAIRPRRGIL
jgi:[calcium/calmodulin-dependent protein kinase] kinase